MSHILHLDLRSARVLAGSDLHAWPGPISTATASFNWVAGELNLDVVLLDGDVLDGARISRFRERGFEWRPTLREELGTGQEQLAAKSPQRHPGAGEIFVLGNHDRASLRLATVETACPSCERSPSILH